MEEDYRNRYFSLCLDTLSLTIKMEMSEIIKTSYKLKIIAF